MAVNPLDYTLARMAELKTKIDELAVHDGKFDEAQQRDWNAHTAEWDSLDERRTELEERARRQSAAAGINFNVNRNPDPFKADLPGVDDRSGALDMGLRAVEEMRSRFPSDDSAGAAYRAIERGDAVGETYARLAVTTGSREYRTAWLGYMTGRSHDLRLLQRANDEYRAMTAGTGASGGFMVPLYMDPAFQVTGAGSWNPIRDLANVKTVTTLTYNGSNAAQVTAGILGENSAFTDNTPTVAQIQLPTYKYGAYIPASFEAFEDIDTLANDVGMLFADAKANAEATQFATGSGSAPHGIVTDVTAVTASRVSPATGGTFVAGDMFKVHSALPARYRHSGQRAWMMSINIIDTIRQFATANVYYAFLTDARGGDPAQLLGDQLVEASTMSTSITTGQNIIIYGDFSRFYIIDRVGISTEFIPNVFDQATGRPSGTRAWLMHWRFGSGVADAAGFRVLLL